HKRALELNPGSWNANYAYSGYLLDIGRTEESLDYARRAYEIDGLSPQSLLGLAKAYLYASQPDQAIQLYRQAIEMEPNFVPAHAQLGLVYIKKEMYEDAISEFQKARAMENTPELPRFTYLPYAYAMAGKREEAQRLLDELKLIARQRYIPPYNFA